MPDKTFEIAEPDVGRMQTFFELMQDLGLGGAKSEEEKSAPERPKGPQNSMAEALGEAGSEEEEAEPARIRISLGGIVSKLHEEGRLEDLATCVTDAGPEEAKNVPLQLLTDGVFFYAAQLAGLWQGLLGTESGMASTPGKAEGTGPSTSAT